MDIGNLVNWIQMGIWALAFLGFVGRLLAKLIKGEDATPSWVKRFLASDWLIGSVIATGLGFSGWCLYSAQTEPQSLRSVIENTGPHNQKDLSTVISLDDANKPGNPILPKEFDTYATVVLKPSPSCSDQQLRSNIWECFTARKKDDGWLQVVMVFHYPVLWNGLRIEDDAGGIIPKTSYRMTMTCERICAVVDIDTDIVEKNSKLRIWPTYETPR